MQQWFVIFVSRFGHWGTALASSFILQLFSSLRSSLFRSRWALKTASNNHLTLLTSPCGANNYLVPLVSTPFGLLLPARAREWSNHNEHVRMQCFQCCSQWVGKTNCSHLSTLTTELAANNPKRVFFFPYLFSPSPLFEMHSKTLNPS